MPKAETVKKQLTFIKPMLSSLSLGTLRLGQNMMGELMERRHRSNVIIKKHDFGNFFGAWVIPRDERREGVILYLHGGGYTSGDLEYALGFASMLADECGCRAFAAAYRLAPENKFPTAVSDSVEAYKYVLSKGYSPSHITLAGESAGGGLCYSLCLSLREMGLPMPAGIVAVSPWTDLTMSGASYETNISADPSMSKEQLQFYADSYTDTPKDPLASPLFGELHGLPPSLIFVGGDEIMLDDAAELHKKLTASKCRSRLIIKPNRWHGYLLYGLTEDRDDIVTLNKFLSRYMAKEHKIRWLRLDNAAKIYPAARRENWSNVFRVSVTLKEPVDRDILASALDVTVRRFPSVAVRLRRGVFWYYLENLSSSPEIKDEYSFPLTKMSREETKKCAFRVILHGSRIAVEYFHAITDGTGAMIFLKSLTAEYIQEKYGVNIPAGNGILARLDEPSEAELEDSFQKYAGALEASRKENTAYHLSGTPEPSGFHHLTCLKYDTNALLQKAHEYGVSLTAFLASAMMLAIQNIERERIPDRKKRRPVKVLIPVNLRKLFKSETMRNFAMYTTPEILPALGDYDFSEICSVVKSKMASDITPKKMSMMIATNVNSERLAIVRIMPLFIKNIVMKAIFDTVGERKSCLSLSNLGEVKLPESMASYVERFDFILGVQATSPYNCGVISYNGTLYVNFIRNIKEPTLEYEFYRVLRDLGLCAEVESNGGSKESEV